MAKKALRTFSNRRPYFQLQGLKNVIGQATTIGRSETAEDETDSNVETSATTTSTSTEASVDQVSTPPEVQSPVMGQSESSSIHQVLQKLLSATLKLLLGGAKASLQLTPPWHCRLVHSSCGTGLSSFQLDVAQ